MLFYIKVVVEVLKCYLEINVFIDGDDVVYYNYFDISIVVFILWGLVILVFCNCDKFLMVDIEKMIKELVVKGCDGKLIVEDLIGGNFMIINGGVFGLLMLILIINLL